MLGVRDDLVIPLDGTDTGPLLEFWRWLLAEDLRPWFATALGDLWLRGPGDAVWWLDVGTGEVQQVAASEAEFRGLPADPENAALWLGGPRADRLAEAGLPRGPGEVYSYQLPPVLGGGTSRGTSGSTTSSPTSRSGARSTDRSTTGRTGRRSSSA